MYVHETDSFGVDESGRLWFKLWYAEDLALGLLERIPDVPAGLVGERAELVDAVADDRGRRAEWDDWRSTYRRQSGV